MSGFALPLHTFTCGACGTSVTSLMTLTAIEAVMRLHAEQCPGYPPAVSAVREHKEPE